MPYFTFFFALKMWQHLSDNPAATATTKSHTRLWSLVCLYMEKRYSGRCDAGVVLSSVLGSFAGLTGSSSGKAQRQKRLMGIIWVRTSNHSRVPEQSCTCEKRSGPHWFLQRDGDYILCMLREPSCEFRVGLLSYPHPPYPYPDF